MRKLICKNSIEYAMFIRGINCSTPNVHAVRLHLHVQVAPWLVHLLFGSSHLGIENEQML